MDIRWAITVMAVVLCVGVQIHMARSVKIEVTPKAATAGKDKEVKVRCTMSETDGQASEMLWMRVARKGGRVLVQMYPNGTVGYIEAEEEEVTVTGKMGTGASIGDSYLEMIIKDPDSEDTGLYICNFRYNETSGGKAKISKKSSQLTVKASDVNEVDDQVKELLEQVKKEEQEIKNMEAKEKQTNKLVPDLKKKAEGVKKKIEKMAKKEEKMNKKMSKIEDKALKQLKKIEELTKKEETEVKSLKSAVDNILNKREKEKNDVKEISGKTEESKGKVKKLEEDVEKKTKELADLGEKEKNVEKKINELEATTKSAVKKIKDIVSVKFLSKKKVDEVDEMVDKKLGELEDLKTKESEMEAKMKELEDKMAEAIGYLEEAENGMGKGTDSTGMDGIDTGRVEVGIDTSNIGNSGGSRVDDVMSAFAVTTQQKYLRLQKGSKLILPDIVMQAGLIGYNPKTGVYKVPVDGLYHFNLSIKVNCVGCYTTVAFKADGKVIAKLRTGTLYDELQNSISTVTQLNKGAEVVLEVQEAGSGVYLTAYRLCVYSGYLVTPAK